MLELRILSGLHRGVALPLDGDAIRLGSGAGNDVVLLDRGMPAHAATLRTADDGTWLLSSCGGDAPQTTVAANMQLHVGPVLVGFAEEDEPWPASVATSMPATPERRANGTVAWIACFAGLAVLLGLAASFGLVSQHRQDPGSTQKAASRGSPHAAPAVRTVDAVVHPAPLESVRPPFGVRSVRGGTHGFVVTDDGRVLIPGNTWRQFTLVRIEPGRLVFSGPQPAELPW